MKKRNQLFILVIIVLSVTIQSSLKVPKAFVIYEQDNLKKVSTYRDNLKEREIGTGYLRANYNECFVNREYSNLDSITYNYLRTKSVELGIPDNLKNIRITKVVASNESKHVYFEQHINDIPIFVSSGSIAINRGDTVTYMVNNFRKIDQTIDFNTKPKIGSAEAIGIASTNLRILNDIRRSPKTQLMFFESKDIGFELAWKVNIVAMDPMGDWRVFVNAENGRIIQVDNIACNHNGSGMVYGPNPITSSQTVYGATGFIDNMDANSTQLENARVSRSLPDITLENGYYKLEGPYCVLSDEEVPYETFPEKTNSNDFNFTRDEQGFEAVMCYYHIDKASRRVESFGYDVAALKTFKADPHGLNGTANAHYVPTYNYVSFGEGGVDAAEDGDVIWHEYAHAIQNNLGEGNLLYTGETKAVQEGSSDYWALSHSRSLTSYNWALFGNWWCSSITGFERRADLNWIYPDDYLSAKTLHEAGQIWSSALMKIWGELGHNKTDEIFLKTHFYWDQDVTMQGAAEAFIAASLALGYNDDYCTIIDYFRLHGLTDRISTLDGVNSTISGPTTVCNTVAVFSIDNLPSDVSVTWIYSDNLTMVSNQGANPAGFIPNGSGIGEIQAMLSSPFSDCIAPITSPVHYVEIGALPPEISDTWSEECNCYVSDPLSTNTTYDWDMIVNNNSINSTDFVWEIWGYELPILNQQTSSTTSSSWPYIAYGKHLSYIFSEEQYYTIKAKHKKCGYWSSWGEKYITVGSGGLFLMVAPNPSTNETTISLNESSEESIMQNGTIFSENVFVDEWELEIYTIGQILIEKRTNLRTNNINIQTQGWEEGVYFIIAKYKEQRIMSKLIVRH